MSGKMYGTADVRRFYQEFAASYHRVEWLESTLLGGRRHRARLFGRAHGAVLDVACGTGANFPYLRHADHITAIELSPAMLQQARARVAADALPPVTLRVMDAEKMAFPDASFDTVVSSMATCTFPDPVQALREMGRVCRPGGRILLFEHGISGWSSLAWVQHRLAPLHYGRTGCRLNQDPADLARAAGLRVEEAERALAGIFFAVSIRC